MLDAWRSGAASRYGVNRSNKLENARGTAAVQHVGVSSGVIDFPPQTAEPGAVGEPGYSRLIELPHGTVPDAPQIANDSGRADKVVSRFSRNVPVRYVSTDSSDAGAAALEDVTLAPALNAAPFAGGDGTNAARAGLAAFVNG